MSRQPSDNRSNGQSGAANGQRPEPTPLGGRRQVLSDETPLATPERHRQQRDRRAFSFPASEDNERPALPFARKTKGINGTPRSFKKKQLHLASDMNKLALSTGANTPNFEPTFDSTSDSSIENNDVAAPVAQRRSPVSPFATLNPAPPIPTQRVHSSSSGVPAVHSPSLSSPLQTARPSLDTRGPITCMGSSSRSRDDIMSWARGVGVDSTSSHHGDSDDETRGRSNRNRPRTRRHLALANLPPPSTEPLDEPSQGSTPKGSVGALGALHMTFTPVVDAIRRVSIAAIPQHSEQFGSSLGIAPVPAPAEVSIVDVIVATRGQEGNNEHVLTEGDTPSLSTMSFAEAVDPSTSTDLGETIDTATDDFSVVSSSIDRRFSPRVTGAQIGHAPAAPKATNNVPQPQQQQRRRSSLRPIQSTASAIWNISSYIRSLTPFAVPALPSFTTPQGEPGHQEAETAVEDEPVNGTPEQQISNLASPVPTTAMHANIGAALEDSLHEHDLVRSVPMDIVITGKTAALFEERQREREALEMIKRGAGSRPRSPIRMDGRSPSCGPDPSSGRPQSYDDDREDDRRGRGRGRGRDRGGAPTPPEDDDGEERRGRRRDRYNESRDRSWSAARGRRASRNRAALLAAFVGADVY